jgi:phosphate:Na+ symporter
MQSFVEENLELAQQVEPLEEVIDGMNMQVRQHHIMRLREGKCTIELGFILADISTDFEQVADHCSNIAVCLLQQL